MLLNVSVMEMCGCDLVLSGPLLCVIYRGGVTEGVWSSSLHLPSKTTPKCMKSRCCRSAWWHLEEWRQADKLCGQNCVSLIMRYWTYGTDCGWKGLPGGASHISCHGISKESPKQSSFMEEQSSIVSDDGTSFHNCALKWLLLTVSLWLLCAQLYLSIRIKAYRKWWPGFVWT